MEQKQITLEQIYYSIQKMQQEIQRISQKIEKKLEFEEWEEDLNAIADTDLLAESWLSKEDEEAFAYLQ
ncbi:hypothetical protein HYV50_01880 [Candidatus Pacearchaeota archaeon]|nr:hypothetical protein [Candidatus Pacearchaeota archaeon]